MSEAADLYNSGLSLRQVGAILHLGHQTVLNRLLAEGVTIRKRGKARVHLDKEAILRDYRTGISERQLGFRYRVNKGTIKRVILEAGEHRRGRSEQGKLTNPKLTVNRKPSTGRPRKPQPDLSGAAALYPGMGINAIARRYHVGPKEVRAELVAQGRQIAKPTRERRRNPGVRKTPTRKPSKRLHARRRELVLVLYHRQVFGANDADTAVRIAGIVTEIEALKEAA